MARFLRSNMARMKKHGNIGAYALEKHIHSNSYNEVRSSFDSVIEMKLQEMEGEPRRFDRVYSYLGGHATRWFPFLIGTDRLVKIY